MISRTACLAMTISTSRSSISPMKIRPSIWAPPVTTTGWQALLAVLSRSVWPRRSKQFNIRGSAMENITETSRRTFLAGASAVTLAGVAGTAVAAPAHKKMRGIYPIAQTPCTADNKLDLGLLASQVKFCTKARVPGVVWPQLASGWITLSDEERFAGAEALLAAAKGTATNVVIGVQARGGDTAQSAKFAKHAEAHGASAVIALVSLSPDKATDAAVVEYYKAIG